jgi:hypothetical protein
VNAVDVVSTKMRVPSVVPMKVRVGVLAEGTFDDPQNARIIYLAVAGLLLLAVVLGVGTWYWWRTNKVEHPALGPLEMMGTRTWRKGDFNSRERHLEEARPANAIHEAEPVEDRDELDLDALGKLEPAQFDDFSDLLPAAAAAAPVALAVAEAESEPDASTPETAADEAVEPFVAEPGPEPDSVPDSAADAESAAPDEPVEESDAEPNAEAIVEPVVEPVAEPVVAPAKQAVIVIDTAPSPVASQQLTFEEPAAESEGDADDDDHFDPLLRLNITE